MKKILIVPERKCFKKTEGTVPSCKRPLAGKINIWTTKCRTSVLDYKSKNKIYIWVHTYINKFLNKEQMDTSSSQKMPINKCRGDKGKNNFNSHSNICCRQETWQMIKLVGEALKINRIFTRLQSIFSLDMQLVSLVHIYEYFETPPSSKWNLIFLHLSMGWTLTTPF